MTTLLPMYESSGTRPNPVDRRLTIVGTYMRWIEPILFPACVIPCLAILSPVWSAPFLLSLFLIPFACIALFIANNWFLKNQKVERWMQSTPMFVVALAVSGSLLLLLLAFIPLGVMSQVGEPVFPAIIHADSTVRLELAFRLACIASAIGLAFRLVLLVMEEFRYLSREHF
jgi:hypothetical protein